MKFRVLIKDPLIYYVMVRVIALLTCKWCLLLLSDATYIYIYIYAYIYIYICIYIYIHIVYMYTNTMWILLQILKVRLSFSKKVGFICLNRNPLKIMKNVFYFRWKALFVLKIFKSRFFFFGVSSYVRKRLDEKAKVNL